MNDLIALRQLYFVLILPRRFRATAVVVVAGLLLLCSGSVRGQEKTAWVELFKLPGGGVVQRAVVTTRRELPVNSDELTVRTPTMVLRRQGVLAVLEGRAITTLLKSAPRVRGLATRPAGVVTLYYVHLLGEGGVRRCIEIYRDPADGFWIGEEAVGMLAVMPRRARLNPMRFAAISIEWPIYGGPFSAEHGATIDDGDKGNVEGDPRGVVFELQQPYQSGWPFMDGRTLKGRTFVVARGGEKPGTTRQLADEKMWVRLPINYSPNVPAGLLVWVHAGPSGVPPAVFAEALDELNLICVGADNSGNNRAVADRYQLALDGVATVRGRYHVDSRRIYVTGISGGGRISSMLIATAPEVFTGAIPIVGINVYKRVPTGDGRFWPATYKKPPSKLFALLRKHRIAVMTGPPDFNYAPSVAAVKVLQREGLDAKLFSYEDMAHELPTADRFLEALRWVDGPSQEVRAKEEAVAKKYMDRYNEKTGGERPANEEERKFLWRVLAAGPWTEAAWEADKLLTGSP